MVDVGCFSIDGLLGTWVILVGKCLQVDEAFTKTDFILVTFNIIDLYLEVFLPSVNVKRNHLIVNRIIGATDLLRLGGLALDRETHLWIGQSVPRLEFSCIDDVD